MRTLGLAACLLLLPGCSVLGGSKPDPSAAPGPTRGESIAQVVGSLRAGDPGTRVRLEVLRVSRMDDEFWHDVSERSVRHGDFHAAPEVHYAVVASRVCRHGLLDFKGRSMGSWFLFRGNGLVAFQHQGFTPRCETIDHFAPAPLDELREEREVSRYAGQRHPRPRPDASAHFRRGFAFLEVDRVEEAERMLRAGSDEVDSMIRSRKDRDLPMDDAERALRKERAALANALEAVRLEREGTSGPEEDYFRGVTP